MKLAELPFVMPLAEWVWGADPSEAVSPHDCLDHIPFSPGPFISGGCLSQLITKALGVTIIVLSCLNKTPIMANMMNSKSAVGFSRISMYSEFFVYANGAAYGILEAHPLTAYGENLALCFQNLILIALIWKFTTNPPVAMQEKLGLLLAGMAYLIFVSSLPTDSRYLLHTSNSIILMYSRGTQVFETFKVKHTGAQSVVTLGMSSAGGIVRIFTTLKETGDMAVLSGFAVGLILNLTMLAQYVIYQQNTQKFLADLQVENDKKKKE